MIYYDLLDKKLSYCQCGDFHYSVEAIPTETFRLTTTGVINLQDESAWRCVNANCPSQVKERILHFVDTMNIKGIGERIIDRLYTEKILKTISDIYKLDYKKISLLEGFGKVGKVREGIERSNDCPLHTLLNALGIQHVGANTAICY